MKRCLRTTHGRRGSITPLMVLTLLGLMGMLALAIDIGAVAIARSQVQNAADAAAMTGARTITGATDNNYAAVPGNAIKAATYNKVLGQDIQGDYQNPTSSGADTYTSGQVTVEGGAYSYIYNDSDASKEGFELTMPGRPTGEPYTAARVTVKSVSPTSFGRVFRPGGFDVQAVATAVHRPRDVIIILDLSGSMRFQSLPGIYLHAGTTAVPSQPYPRNTSMNPDPDFPKFGHYSDTSAAALLGNTSYSTGAENVDPTNLTYKSNSGPVIMDDFFSSGSTKAFTRAASSKATTPGGDNFPKYSGSYVSTVSGYLNGATDETTLRNWQKNGYGTWNGYTEGPAYWGKTFFVWPPDPRGSDKDANDSANYADNGAKDWRQRFFFKYNPTSKKLFWLDHNSLLWNPSGTPYTNPANTPNPIVRAPNSSVSITENGTATDFQLRINYAAILKWLHSSPNPFPASMTTGRITYYSAIPDPSSDTGLNSRFWAASSLTNDEKFWKEYIDFMLGLTASGSTYSAGTASTVASSMIGNGDFYQWGTVQVSNKADCTYYGQISRSGGYAAGVGVIIVDNVKRSSDQTTYTPLADHFVRINYGSTIYKIKSVSSALGVHTLTFYTGETTAVLCSNNDIVQFYSSVPRYMSHSDNPYRPRHQYWFGPQTWADWLGNYQTNKFWWPGNVHEAQAWACKVGIQTAIDDIKKNHPSDYVGMAFFSEPRTAVGDTVGWHNRAIVPVGRNYDQLKEALWFPPSTVTGGKKTISCWDADMDNVPRANGSTAPGSGLMIAYNQLSNSTTLRTYALPSTTYRGNAGGLGRKGANRLVILETDGSPNFRGHASMGGSGKDAYYKIRIKNPELISDAANEFPSSGSYSATESYNIVKQICAQDTADPAGYSNSRKPALVYAIGYGTLFDPAKTSTGQTNALTFLQTVQFHGNTATTTNPTDFPDWQRIYGTNDQRIERLRTAFTNIMQSGIQVSLIQ